MGGGHQPAQHAAAVLAADLRGADRGAHRRSAERKAEIEILQELIPLAKSRYSAGRGNATQGTARAPPTSSYTVDTPVPYRISDLIAPHRRAHGQAREQARPRALSQPEDAHRDHLASTRAMPSCSARSPSTTAWRRCWAASSACLSTASRSPSSNLPASRRKSSTSSSPCSAA